MLEEERNRLKENKNIQDTNNEEQSENTSAPEVNNRETPFSSEAIIADLEKQVEFYKDQLYRKAADFENYKKRIESEFAYISKSATEELLRSVLPILDDLERSLKIGSEIKEHEAFFKGVEMIYQKFLKTLETRGIKLMETVGKPFDVEYHDALLQVPRSDIPPHTIIEEVEKGYLIHDKVLRHAKVIVSTDGEPIEKLNSESSEVNDEDINGKKKES